MSVFIDMVTQFQLNPITGGELISSIHMAVCILNMLPNESLALMHYARLIWVTIQHITHTHTHAQSNKLNGY